MADLRAFCTTARFAPLCGIFTTLWTPDSLAPTRYHRAMSAGHDHHHHHTGAAHGHDRAFALGVVLNTGFVVLEATAGRPHSAGAAGLARAVLPAR